MKIQFDYSKLLGRIREKGLTQEQVATHIGIAPATLSLRFSGQGYFRQPEIKKMCQLLEIREEEIGAFFYKVKV